MASIKKKLQALAQVGLVGIGFITLGFKGDRGNDTDNSAPKAPIVSVAPQDAYALIDESLPEDERQHLIQIIDWANEVPSGRQILQAIIDNQTRLNVDDLGDMSAGFTQPDLVLISFDRSILKQRMDDAPLDEFGTFIHEGEHVRTMANDHKNGITLNSFASMDDKHTWETAREALAVRKGYMAIAELVRVHPELDKNHAFADALQKNFNGNVEKMAEAFFTKRMMADISSDAVHIYESGVIWQGIEKNEFLDASRLKKLSVNPNWNHLIRQASGGEVTTLNVLPIPSMQMVESLLQEGYDWNKQAIDWKQIDMTCVEQNKDAIAQGEEFCLYLCKEVARTASVVLGDVKDPNQLKPWFDEMKSIMPEADAQKLFSAETDIGLPKDWGDSDEFWRFLDAQNNFEYLKKVQKLLASPNLKKGYENNLKPDCVDDFGNLIRRDPTDLLHRDLLFLKTYERLFFEKESRKLAMKTGQMMPSVHF